MGGNPGVESRPLAHKTAAGVVWIEQYHDRLQRIRHATPVKLEVEILPNRLPTFAGRSGASQMESLGLWYSGQPGHFDQAAWRVERRQHCTILPYRYPAPIHQHAHRSVTQTQRRQHMITGLSLVHAIVDQNLMFRFVAAARNHPAKTQRLGMLQAPGKAEPQVAADGDRIRPASAVFAQRGRAATDRDRSSAAAAPASPASATNRHAVAVGPHAGARTDATAS